MERKALLVLRRNMDVFISVDQIDVVFTRVNRVFNPSTGGWTEGTPIVLNPQQFRMVPFKRRLSDATQNTQDGPLKLADYILVGRPDVDVEVGDEFDHNGQHYRVKDIELKSDDREQTDRVTVALEVRGT